MATAEEKRLKVRDKYRTIIGRNIYSQDRRNYCYKKYSNGKYYSDCSSSICWTYKEVGLGFGILNTAGMWVSKKLVDVPVKIKNGIIQNPEVLRIGDMLLFAGTSAARKNYGYVGHVEMVGEISSSGKVTLYGHGYSNPKKQEMNKYCKKRYAKKTKATKLGHTGLIRVRRFIQDDGSEKGQTTSATPVTPVTPVTPTEKYTLGLRTLKNGMKGDDVKKLQELLVKIGYSVGKYGVDGEYGNDTEAAVKVFQNDNSLNTTGVFDDETYCMLLRYIYKDVEIIGGSVNVRTGPTSNDMIMGIAYKGEKLPFLGVISEGGWYKVRYGIEDGWISNKYAKLSN